MADYGLWQGLEKSTGRLPALGMGLLQYKQRQAQIKIAQDIDKRSELTFEHNQKKWEEEERIRKTPIPASMIMPGLKDRPNFAKGAVEWAKSAGYEVTVRKSDGEIFAPPPVYKFIAEQLQANNTFKKSSIEANLLDLQAQSLKLNALINEGKGKPEEIEAWKKKKTAIDTSYGQMLAQKEIAVAEAKKVPPETLERIKAEARARAEGTAAGTPPKEPIDQAIRTFEIQHYGKLVPQLRGTPSYIEKLNAAKKAGAMNINIAGERFDIQKQATAGEVRTGLATNKDDKNYYEANADIFNSINKKNEVAYWDDGGEKAGRFYDEESKIIKLSPSAISAGWTPKKIQEAANAKGKTVQEVLRDIGIIK